jgi:hypothetical protein
MTRHLDGESWAKLQQQRDDELLAHVDAGCTQCDEFLATVGLEGEVDRTLLSLAPRAPSTDELAWARFRRAQQQAGQRQGSPTRRVALAAAALVVLSAVGFALTRPARDDSPWDGLKGSDSRGRLELRAALKTGSGSLKPIADGAAVPSTAALVFQVRSSVSGPARLFIQRGDGAPTELTQVGLVQGAQELEQGEGLLGFSLSGERGPVWVWLVAAETPMSAQTALEAIRLGGEAGVVVAKLRVDVTP